MFVPEFPQMIKLLSDETNVELSVVPICPLKVK